MTEFLQQHLFSCSFKASLGVECPGCGMQRAFIELLRGDLVKSLSFNPSLIPFLITLIYALLHITLGFRQGARNTVVMFAVTSFIMVLNFVIKLLS